MSTSPFDSAAAKGCRSAYHCFHYAEFHAVGSATLELVFDMVVTPANVKYSFTFPPQYRQGVVRDCTLDFCVVSSLTIPGPTARIENDQIPSLPLPPPLVLPCHLTKSNIRRTQDRCKTSRSALQRSQRYLHSRTGRPRETKAWWA